MRLYLTGIILATLSCYINSCINDTQSKKSSGDSAKAMSMKELRIDSAKTASMNELNAEIAEAVNAFIMGGFHDKDETFESIQDMFYNETLDEVRVKKEIERQFQKRLAEQATWERETDFDRLARVFDKLNSSGIIAIHNAGYTRQDGESDTRELHEELKAKKIVTRGYCFYHTQDMDHVIEGDNLFLAFGDFEANDEAGINIGKEIVAALRENGFKTNWNKSIESRIEVRGIKWKKRFGNDNCSDERAITLLSKNKTT